jgi:hypothetical protein
MRAKESCASRQQVPSLPFRIFMRARRVRSTSLLEYGITALLTFARPGYYTFQECGSQTNPTIGIEIGETYTFIQQDMHNYMHPLGFAYFPDGAHDDKAELEPGVVPGGALAGGCADTLTCPAPMYFKNGEYVGVYSNIPDVKNVTTGEGDFGLDNYEPLFFRNLVDWTDFGTFKVMLRFDQDYDQDVFYFCHVRLCCQLYPAWLWTANVLHARAWDPSPTICRCTNSCPAASSCLETESLLTRLMLPRSRTSMTSQGLSINNAERLVWTATNYPTPIAQINLFATKKRPLRR